MSKLELLEYWPLREQVAACLKVDAEASNEAVALAVHQRMRFERKVIGGDGASLPECDEHELLEAFLAPDLSDGRAIIPIVGASGTGKSHVIRWLDTQVRHMEGNESRIVIRIPKGTSLKGVLGILLNTLDGSGFDEYRKELKRAQEELDPKEAAGLLCEMLAQTLEQTWARARQKLVANPGDHDAREREAYCRREMLPTLLRNQFLRDHHFVGVGEGSNGVAKRLVEQLTESRSAELGDDRQHLFTAADLVFSPSIDRDSLGRAEARAISQLDREDRREAAARILNEALDSAKQQLLHIDPTVSDLFTAVREQLLKEGKELVLLIEDFVVLSGIQKQVLQVIIKEAYRDGRQVLCTMRTAIAYTTGYMDADTVLTRANVEYRIPDEPGTEEEIYSRIEQLVGAYLNAARLGERILENAFKEIRSTGEPLDSWIPIFHAAVEHEARATLDDFGKSSASYELFPFNRAAIRELSQDGCRQAGHLVYNPRFVIQNVIYKVLNQRDLFVEGHFPPANFGAQNRPLFSKVVEEVKRRVPARELERYLKLLAYWGGFPATIAEAVRLESRVFTAFGFDKNLLSKGVQAAPAPEPKPEPGEATAEGSRQKPEQDPAERKWETLLENWRARKTLPQAEANQLRKWIAEALKGFVSWDWELYRPLRGLNFDGWAEWIYIPQAAGHQGRSAEEAMVSVCSEADLSDVTKSAAVQSSLMAIIRFHGINKGNWDYAGAEIDLPRYYAFVEGIAKSARSFVMGRYFKPDWNPIPAIVEGLLLGARALGSESAAKDKNPDALIHSLFEVLPTSSAAQAGNPTPNEAAMAWTDFTNGLRRCRRSGEKELRDQLSWQGHLLNLVGARQGQAEIVYAIDVSRLKPAIEGTLSNWDFTAKLPGSAGAPDYTTFRAGYADLKKLAGAISKAQQRLYRWRKETIQWLGDPSEKESLVSEMKLAVEAAKEAGMTKDLDSKGLLQLLEEFRSAKVVAALDDADKLDRDAPRGVVLTILGRGYETVAQLCEKLGSRVEEFLKAVEGDLASDAAKWGMNPLQDAVNSLNAELNELETVLKGVESL
jgi:hypothetical protein